jgi:hypothetical protein
MKHLTAKELSNHENGYFYWIDDETHNIKVIMFDNGKRTDHTFETNEEFEKFLTELK